ncbi:MAG TPA: DoxX family protein [Gemmatimonadales bacterium]|jgi:putative oxidoreductase|nr:DoxX family protein [Gemmatimonadales bacterium]
MTEPTLAAKWRSWSPYLLSILRIVVAFLFIQFGTGKVFALPAAIMPEGGTAPFGTLAWFAGFLETFGGLFILLGLFTRPVAFLLSGEMAFAYFIGHAPQGFWPVLNQGHSAILFCFVFLYFSSAGAGPWSLDELRERKRGAHRRSA